MTSSRKFIAVVCIVITMAGVLLAGCANKHSDNVVKYEGKEYVCLEYPQNIFYYDYHGNSEDNFEEVDGIYPIASPNWEMIWNGGDLYCAMESGAEAREYYSLDENYEWYVKVDSPEDVEEQACLINVTAEELDSIYGLEELEQEMSLFFEEFEALGSIMKVSKDGIVRGTLSIVKYQGQWYWNTEVIDESKEQDGTWPEYVQPLPKSLSEKIS